MQKMSQVGQDAKYQLTQEQYQEVMKGAAEVVRHATIARKIAPMTFEDDIGVFDFQFYTKVDIEMPKIDLRMQDTKYIHPSYKKTNVEVPSIYSDFYVSNRDLKASQRGGPGSLLDTAKLDMGSKYAEAEDRFLFNGSASTGSLDILDTSILGLINHTDAQDAGNPAGAWDAAATNVYVDFLKMIKKLQEDKHYGPYFGVVTPGAGACLTQLLYDGAQYGQRTWKDFIEKELCTLGVYITDALFPAWASATNKALVAAPETNGKPNFELRVYQDPKIDQYSVKSGVDLRYWGISVPVIYHGEAVSWIDAIDDTT